MPLSLFFANALGPLARLQTKDGHPHPPCRCAAGEASCSSAFSSSMFSSSSCKQQQRRRQNNQRINVVARASSSTPSNPPQRSFDGDEDELDHESAAELAKYVDPERVKQEQKRLELAWAVREKVRIYFFVESEFDRSMVPTRRDKALFFCFNLHLASFCLLLFFSPVIVLQSKSS